MPDIATYRQQKQLAADARNRALRTFLVGLVIDLTVAVALVLVTALADIGSWGEVQWSLLSFTVAKTLVSTGCSYLLRRFVDPSGIPTPLPPADPGEPDDDTPVAA